VLAAAAAAAPALRRSRFAPAALAVIACLLGLFFLILIGVLGALFGLRSPFPQGFRPSQVARADIPPAYLRLYEEAGDRYGIDPWVLAGIGSMETDHGRSRAPGVHSGVNAFGCCAGPMQFSLVGSPSTWDRYGVDGDHDGRTSPYDPGDAIPAAARYLRAAGAPGDYHAAIFAYNHADWYVAEVLAKADQYRGAPVTSAGDEGEPNLDAGAAREVVANPRITVTPIQRSDLRSGLIDPRVIATLAWIGQHHSVVITALRSDHSEFTVDGNVSNHSAGRAMDIGAVDGEVCRGTRTGRCADLVRELAAVQGELRSTELIYCWDPDGPSDPRGFARADHCDHIHVGFDG
jgi:hypothetical protein